MSVPASLEEPLTSVSPARGPRRPHPSWAHHVGSALDVFVQPFVEHDLLTVICMVPLGKIAVERHLFEDGLVHSFPHVLRTPYEHPDDQILGLKIHTAQ